MRKPEVEHLPLQQKLSALGSYRSQLATHVESRRQLHSRIGTGEVRYDPNDFYTIPEAVRIGGVKDRVRQSINRIETKIDGIDQEVQDLILSDEAVTLRAVGYLHQAVIHAQNGHIPWKDFEKYKKQLGDIPYRYYKKLAEQNPGDSTAWANLGYWATSKQEKIDCLKNASELDPEDPINWYNLGLHTSSLFDIYAAYRNPINKQEQRLLLTSALSYYRQYLNAQERNPQPNQKRYLEKAQDAIKSLETDLRFLS